MDTRDELKRDHVPARVHIILARAANTAVIIRRGPDKQMCVLGWDRSNDTIHVGQWLKGRIFEDYCDLSPDGRHFLYYAENRRPNPSDVYQWSAISRAPYLKALGFWPMNGWTGGGLFLSDHCYWLHGPHGLHPLTRDETGLQPASQPPSVSDDVRDLSIYGMRLERDGWVKKRRKNDSAPTQIYLEKPVDQYWSLRKFFHRGSPKRKGSGLRDEAHELYNHRTGQLIELPDWRWADLDGDRLAWVVDGCLRTARVGDEGIVREKEIYDFNPLTWQSIEAPY